MAELSTIAPEYEVVIEPSSKWLHLRWREFWEYRDLLFVLVRRDYISRYKQTVLGPLWFILQPLITTAIFTVIFGRMAGIPTDGIPQPLFYLAGLLAWNYFAQNVTVGGATFINNAHLFGKVWFPRLIVPVATMISNLVSVALQFIPLILVFLYYKVVAGTDAVSVTGLVLLVPVVLLQIACLSLGVSLWMSASTAKYRDLVHLTQYIIQIWMFATPLFAPLSQYRDKLGLFALLNPMAAPAEAMRLCLLGRGSLGWMDIAISVGITVVVLITGIALFQRVERTVVDTV